LLLQANFRLRRKQIAPHSHDVEALLIDPSNTLRQHMRLAPSGATQRNFEGRLHFWGVTFIGTFSATNRAQPQPKGK
jgi:hypothetical protein